MTNIKTIFHRDGTVTYWDVYAQMWQRRVDPDDIGDAILASLPGKDADRIVARRRCSG